jgi:hypothetical protein
MPGPPAGDPPDHPGRFPHFDEPDAKDGLPGLPDGWEDAPVRTPGAAGSGDEDEGSGNDTADGREDDARRTVLVYVCGDVRDVDIDDVFAVVDQHFNYHNHERRHSALGNMPPMGYLQREGFPSVSRD